MNILELKQEDGSIRRLTPSEIVESFVKGIDAEYIHLSKAPTGGDSIYLLVVLESKENWAHGIMENSIYTRFRIESNGVVENWQRFDREVPKLRKFTGKSLELIIERINKHIQMAKKLLL